MPQPIHIAGIVYAYLPDGSSILHCPGFAKETLWMETRGRAGLVNHRAGRHIFCVHTPLDAGKHVVLCTNCFDAPEGEAPMCGHIERRSQLSPR